MNHPTPQEALDLIDRALQLVNGTRQDHINLQSAVQTVRIAVSKLERPATEADDGVDDGEAKPSD